MKQIDFYAQMQSAKTTRRVAGALGGIFGLIVIVCGVLIVQLTRHPHAAQSIAQALPVAAVAAVASAPVAEAKPVVAEAKPVAAPTAAEPAQAASAPVAQASAPVAKAHAKKPKLTSAQRHRAILAKHDSKKSTSKSDLDRLLGL